MKIYMVIMVCMLSACYHYQPTAITLGKMDHFFARNIVDAAYAAYTDIKKCQHPALMDKLQLLDNLEFRLAPAALCRTEGPEACACVIRDIGPIIWLNDDTGKWTEGRCNFYPIICHEMLHLMGFSHSEPYLLREVEWMCCYDY